MRPAFCSNFSSQKPPNLKEPTRQSHPVDDQGFVARGKLFVTLPRVVIHYPRSALRDISCNIRQDRPQPLFLETETGDFRSEVYLTLALNTTDMLQSERKQRTRSYSWTRDNDKSILHHRLIGRGGFAEVHEVFSYRSHLPDL